MAEAAHPGAALFPAPLTGRRPRRALGLRQVPEQVHGGGAVERRLRATLGGGGGGGAVTHRGRPCQSRAAQPPPQSATRGGGAGRGGLRKRTGAFGLGIWSRDKLLWRFPGKKGVVAPNLTFGGRGRSAPVRCSLCDRAGKAPSDRPGEQDSAQRGSPLSHWDRDQKKHHR